MKISQWIVLKAKPGFDDLYLKEVRTIRNNKVNRVIFGCSDLWSDAILFPTEDAASTAASSANQTEDQVYRVARIDINIVSR